MTAINEYERRMVIELIKTTLINHPTPPEGLTKSEYITRIAKKAAGILWRTSK